MLEPVPDPERSPEAGLWIAALSLLVDDARRYAEGRTPKQPPVRNPASAFNDVLACGPMLRHLCDHCPEYEQEAISEAFRRWLRKSNLDRQPDRPEFRNHVLLRDDERSMGAQP